MADQLHLVSLISYNYFKMLQCSVNIQIIQVQPYVDSDGNKVARNEIFNIGFCNSFETYSSWQDLCDTATIELPKNVYVKDVNNSSIIWGEATSPDKLKGYVNAAGFKNKQVSKAPLIMRGDEVYISAGYSYIAQVNPDNSLTYSNKINNVFHGFVSSIESKSNLKIHCEDFMWLLKQTNMQPKTYGPKNDISDVLKDIEAISNNVNNDYLITTNTGDFKLCVDGFRTDNETAAETLNNLKKIMPSLAFYFRDAELRGGGIVYYPIDQSTGTDNNGDPAYKTFTFQKNIISDELHFNLKDDVRIGAICYSVNSTEGSVTNKMGGKQYTTTRTEVTVGATKQDNAEAFEFYNFYFPNITDDALTSQGQIYLNRYHYDGFRGNFKTFGLPFVQHGNIVYLTDNLLPERNGHYMVKGVHYTFSVNSGLRQDIELHFRTDGLSQSQLGQGM